MSNATADLPATSDDDAEEIARCGQCDLALGDAIACMFSLVLLLRLKRVASAELVELSYLRISTAEVPNSHHQWHAYVS
eukprot:704360-Amphidinium_carterae.1